MDNFKTIEVRWFYPGILPTEILTWFNKAGEPPVKPDIRRDVYLESISPDIGIKLREGNLEVKYRQAKIESLAQSLPGGIEIDSCGISQVESWSKWICVDDTSSLTPADVANKVGWINVDKIRYQRVYKVVFDEDVQLTSISKPQANAGAIEVTGLRVFEQDWWTIACEYLGDDISVNFQFLPLVRSLLSGYPLCLDSPFECGYPEWLNQID